jgi:hypothetical protein
MGIRGNEATGQQRTGQPSRPGTGQRDKQKGRHERHTRTAIAQPRCDAKPPVLLCRRACCLFVCLSVCPVPLSLRPVSSQPGRQRLARRPAHAGRGRRCARLSVVASVFPSCSLPLLPFRLCAAAAAADCSLAAAERSGTRRGNRQGTDEARSGRTKKITGKPTTHPNTYNTIVAFFGVLSVKAYNSKEGDSFEVLRKRPRFSRTAACHALKMRDHV